jgi:hypothetical protein
MAHLVTYINHFKPEKLEATGPFFKYNGKPFFLQTDWLNLEYNTLTYPKNSDNKIRFYHGSSDSHFKLLNFFDLLVQFTYQKYGKYPLNINMSLDHKGLSNKIKNYPPSTVLKIDKNCKIVGNKIHDGLQKISLDEFKKSKGSSIRFIMRIGPWQEGVFGGYLVLNIMAIEIDLSYIPGIFSLYNFIEDHDPEAAEIQEDSNPEAIEIQESDLNIIEITI